MEAGPRDLRLAIERLHEGGLVAFPTETVYGLGARALDSRAIAGVFRAKGRPSNNPLIVHVAGAAMARRVCAAWPEGAAALAQRFWPGPLTLVLPKASCVPDEATAGGRTVAVRCPDHPLTLALLEGLGEPLVGPSANRSGGVSPTCAAHVRGAFSQDTVFVLDGGPCRGGIESTVVDLTGDSPRVLRPGLVPDERIAKVLGNPVGLSEEDEEGVVRRSPGRLASHYAPASPARLVDPGELGVALSQVEDGSSAVVLDPGVSGPALGQAHTRIPMPSEPDAYARRLYAALREADTARPGVVLIVRPWGADGPSGLWKAIADRLSRATSGG